MAVIVVAMSSPQSLADFMHVVGPSILSFLPPKDILCSLQFASTEIRQICVNSRETWREFVHKYCLGLDMQGDYGSKDEYPTVRLIMEQGKAKYRLNQVPNDVLFSIITGMIPAKFTMRYPRYTNRLRDNMPGRISPFKKVKFHEINYGDTEAQLKVYRSGQWGVFLRIKLDYRRRRPFDYRIDIETLGHAEGRAAAIGAWDFEFHDIDKEFGWFDFMLGEIDVQKIQNKSESEPQNKSESELQDQPESEYDDQPEFERLNTPISIRVRFCNKFEKGLDGQTNDVCFSDFVYLWPMYDCYYDGQPEEYDLYAETKGSNYYYGSDSNESDGHENDKNGNDSDNNSSKKRKKNDDNNDNKKKKKKQDERCLVVNDSNGPESKVSLKSCGIAVIK